MGMKIISFSLTGNNEALAAGIARLLSAEQIKVLESKPRTIGTIAFDMLFNRSPIIDFNIESIQDADKIILVAPVWMGMVASPLRAVLKMLKKKDNPYAFVSISGGAMGPNPKLYTELKRRTGREPDVIVDNQIVSLLPTDPKPTRDDTSTYKLKPEDVENLAKKSLELIKNVWI